MTIYNNFVHIKKWTNIFNDKVFGYDVTKI